MFDADQAQAYGQHGAYVTTMRVAFVHRDDEPFGRQLLKSLEQIFLEVPIEILMGQDIATFVDQESSLIDIIVIANGKGVLDERSVLTLRRRFPLVPILFFKARGNALGISLKCALKVAGVAVICFDRDQFKQAMLVATKARVERLKLALHIAVTQRAHGLEAITRHGILRLTPQEFRVMLAVREGKPNKLVARDLNITVRTVKAHLTRIFKKMQVTQRAQLIACTTSLEDEIWDER